MYRSIFHWQPILNGYSGFWPAGFPERMRLVYQLPDSSAVAALRRETGLSMILVDLDQRVDRSRAASYRALARGGEGMLAPIANDGHLLLLTVGDPPSTR
jgi:hypothetical protein